MSSIVRRAGSKLLRLLARALDPGGTANEVKVYGKDVAGITELFAQTSGSTVNQLTPVSQFASVATFFGNGADGAIVFDGVATITLRTDRVSNSSATSGGMSLAPVASVYTLEGDLFCTDVTIAVGVEVRTAGFAIFCTGTFTNNGTYGEKGVTGTASGGVGGGAGGSRAAQTERMFSFGSSGGAGGSVAVPTGVAGTSVTGGPIYQASPTLANGSKLAGGTMQGGCGGDNDAGTGGAGSGGNTGAPQSNNFYELIAVFLGRSHISTSVLRCGAASGGGGGRGGAVGGGGGGGEGSPNVGIFARSIVGAGTIRAQGGDGGAGNSDGGGGGGGGGGAVVIVTASAFPLPVTVSVTGGVGGDAGANQGKSGGTGLVFEYQLAA